MATLEFHRDEYTVSTDRSRVPADQLYDLLHQYTYWAQKRTPEVVQRSIENSLCFGLYKEDELVGFARVVTDYATFGWLCDVIIHPAHRKRGLGKWLVECVVSHPDLKEIRRLMLATNDAQGLYREYGGFEPLTNPERWMARVNSNA